MKKEKFKKGDRVRINPLATRKDFDRNGCTTKFMDDLNKEYIVEDTGYNHWGGEYICYIDCWWILENCLIHAKEENEI